VAKLKKYNLEGKASGEVDLADQIAEAQVNGQLLKDYIVAIRKNMRQWSACTQDRSEVNHSGQKPHKQKGLGRARQGSLAAPQFRGGGVVFGPKPKFNQHVRINQKERRQAIRALIGEKAREGRLHVVEEPNLESPSTKRLAAFLKGVGLTGYRTLFLTGAQESNYQHLYKSIRNLPKTECTLCRIASGYDLLKHGDVVLTEAALAELNQQLEGA
jgi:large subunit ribosomal protein L4